MKTLMLSLQESCDVNIFVNGEGGTRKRLKRITGRIGREKPKRKRWNIRPKGKELPVLMGNNENAPRRSCTSSGEQTKEKTLTPEYLLSRFKCITRHGGLQAIRWLPYNIRNLVYSDAKKEFMVLQASCECVCDYDRFVRVLVGVCNL